MVVDCVLFYNELDLLEIRLNILNNVVDKFVIVEATKTFVGNRKPLFFKENMGRYSKWKDKIVHYVIDELTDEEWEKAKQSPNVGQGQHWWVREYCQKERMLDALSFCNDDDVVFISDLDEIWNPDMEIKKDGQTYKPIQTAYHYYLNNRSDQHHSGWTGTCYGTYKRLKEVGVNHFRTERENPRILVENGGWHFSYIGDESFIRTKIESFGHQEYNSSIIKNRIKGAIENNTDFLGRGFKLWVDESQLPEYLIKNKEQWKKLFL